MIVCPVYWSFITVTAKIYADLILSNEVDEAPALKGQFTLGEGHKTACHQRRPPALSVSSGDRISMSLGTCAEGNAAFPPLGTFLPRSLVPKVGVEPTRVSPHEFESCASACSATSAQNPV